MEFSFHELLYVVRLLQVNFPSCVIESYVLPSADNFFTIHMYGFFCFFLAYWKLNFRIRCDILWGRRGNYDEWSFNFRIKQTDSTWIGHGNILRIWHFFHILLLFSIVVFFQILFAPLGNREWPRNNFFRHCPKTSLCLNGEKHGA